MPNPFIPIDSVENKNISGYTYLLGDEFTNGSIRFSIDPDSGIPLLEKRITGLWQPESLEASTQTIWLGVTGLASIGHHFATELKDGHMHFFAHSEFDGQLSTVDTRMLNAYFYEAHMAVVPDESGEWTGTTYDYNYPSTDHRMFEKVYFKTGATPASEYVYIQVWEGTDDTGVRVFKQKYPASEFPANTEIPLIAKGRLEFDTGVTYHIRLESTATFSLKTTADKLYPYTYGDISLLYEDNLLQTQPWISGMSWSEKQLYINNRQIYVCKVTGVQTGTFSSNSDKWSNISDESADLWDLSGDTLQNQSGPTTFIFNDVTRDRFIVDPQDSRIISPNGSFKIIANNTGSYLTDSNRDRILINSADSQILSPNGASSLKVDNAEIELISTGITFKPAAADRMVLSLTGLGMIYKGDVGYQLVLGIGQTTLYSPDQNISVDVANQQITFADTANGAGAVSLKYDKDTGLVVYSVNRQSSITLSNSILDNQTTWFNIGDGVRTRFNTTTIQTGMYSPNGVNNVVSTNTGTVIGGAISVCDGLGSNSFTIMPYAEHYSGGSLTLVGADKNDEPLTYFENYHIDNFWGYMRIYTSGNSTKYIRMQNVSDIATSPNKKLIVEVSGNQIIQGDQGFNATNETATLYMGDTNNYLQAIYGTGLKLVADDDLEIVVDGNFDMKRGTQVRMRVNLTDTELISPNEVFNFLLQDGFVRVFDYTNSQIRFDIDSSESKLYSPDGNTHLAIHNNFAQIVSTQSAFYPPTLTTSQRDAMPLTSAGAIIYNLTTDAFNFYENGAWVTK